MARHITDEHGGLSLDIASAANKLKNKLNIIWQQMKAKSNDFPCCSDFIPLVRYRSKFIPKEAKLCLLICSMYPDDCRIPIDELVIYGMGIELFEDVHDMFAAKCRVHHIISIINDLKYPRQPIGGKIRLANERDGPGYQYLEMLDDTRDLAKSILSRNGLVFHREIIIEKWPESISYKDCYGLSLVLKKVDEHPVNLECPKLTLLQLQYREDSGSIPIDFFERMKELRVLSLDVPSLPQSLNVLRNLRTLRLKAPKFGDMSWIGGLIKLEFLSIFVLSLTDIPREMGQLENLRLLDLRKMNIAYIPAGVLSRLLKLEELYFPLCFTRWGCKPKNNDDYDEWESGEEDISDDEERVNASLTEIVSLSLNALQITLPKASNLPKKSLIFKNIQEFKILVPNNVKYEPFGQGSINQLQLTGDACDIKESGICDLMSRTEDLSLARVRNLKNVIYLLEDSDFSQLKKMIISECDELEYVVDRTKKPMMSEGDYLFRKLECLHLSMLSNLKKICHERWITSRWLPNLSHISIRFCHKLKYVFPLSIVRRSILKNIEILDCNEMEGIFYEDEDDIPFTKCSIEELDLHSLPRLISLLVHKDNTINGGTQ
ncbi:disease resistance protein At4g27190-like isoform X1 [Euphorbia lathyris]|uniref:disease resistance protein At4g27190-like isoform X1 n=1 Tax=Euphorbia lathyris TaxID=212925 RepID=UPI0033142788